MTITIIPDIHADLNRLGISLRLAELRGARPAYLGDFIDAGKVLTGDAADREVLQRVRKQIDADTATAVLGNHELNAILYHRKGSGGTPLRAHSAPNAKQHRSFVNAFGAGTDDARYWTDWFLEALPLWHEGDGFRLVHACWSDPEIELVRARRPDGRLRPEDLPEVANKTTDFAKAVERLVSGAEVGLPNGFHFMDGAGNMRNHVRLRWWGDGRSWREMALSVPADATLPDGEISQGIAPAAYPNAAPPVFVGHYKMAGEPKLEHPRVASLDYPLSPCVYHWGGEPVLSTDNLNLLDWPGED
ncbi:metallophosphoesterase [Aquamicrobium soli]|uniref:Metallophosphoesterase n=1 Tax=Aquamicrobium soli TaxID=1811518 RepID=A0ABV7K5K6_9HYPH